MAAVEHSSQIAFAWAANLHSPAAAVLVTAAFALLAWILRGVNLSGAIAGAVVCFVLYVSAGPGAFLVLVAVFAITWAATRLGYRRKQKLGTAERSGGRRASQVLANLSVAAISGLISLLLKNPTWVLAVSAALCEAAGDTVSSELGQALSPRARLITTWEKVPAGTDGGISLAGTLAGVIAALLIAVICAATGLITVSQISIPVTAAIAGVLADSCLGAGLERRGWLSNDLVNLLGTLTAAAVALLLARL